VAETLSAGEWAKISKAVAEMMQLEIQFIESSPTVAEIRAQVRAQQVIGRPCGLVIVDYLQLLTPPRGGGDQRQNEVSEIARSLKVLAMQAEVPVVALSQLSRNVELRMDKHPVLADLRDSGELEQAADTVVFLFRPEHYEPGIDTGIVELHVAKQRMGRTGTVRAAWVGENTAILPLDPHH
jgi:replicative DNA helicase